MLKIIKNKTLQTIVSANLFATLGVSIFNIILLTYAKSFFTSHLFVSIVSIALIIPSIFGGMTGKMADQTQQKTNWLILTKIIQVILYLFLAQIINHKIVFVFYLVVGINLISDIIGNYGGNLLTIIIQDRIEDRSRQQTMGLNSAISTLVEPLGQSVGVFVITQTHNYSLAGLINALTFLVSAICLIVGRRSIATTTRVKPKRTANGLWPIIQKLMLQTTGMGAISYLGIVMVLNIVVVSFDAILNLLFIDLAPVLKINYAVAILTINITYVVGSVWGSVTKKTWIDRLNLFQLLLVTLMAPIIAFSLLLFYPNFYLILLSMFIVSFMSGKMDPKMFATMMPQIDPHMTGSVFGTISTIVTLGAPIGSTGIIILYNLYGGKIACLCALILSLSSIIWALLAYRNR